MPEQFKYPCGCFMMLNGYSGGAGKHCDKCKEQQKHDMQEYCSKIENKFKILKSSVTVIDEKGGGL